MTQNKPELLVIEDDKGLQKQLKWSLDEYHVVLAEDKDTSLVELRRFQPKVITLDLGLPPDPANASVGLELLDEILKLSPSSKIIVVTGNDQREVAMKSVEMGAYDYYQKPIQPEELKLIIKRAFELASLEEESRVYRRNENMRFHGVVATSPLMLSVCQKIEKVAPTDLNVLLEGDSGTGKEVLARAIHSISPRQEKPFVHLNCAAIPENLLETELFGYDATGFSENKSTSKGKIEEANTGVLFLDEVGKMPMSVQAKLMRVLNDGVVARVGSREEKKVDIRVICSTHEDLNQKVQEGKFREDLFYKLDEINIKVPVLAERDGDVVLIARTLLNKFNQQFGRNIRGFTKEAVQAMEAYSWPGNVRELENKIKSAVVMSESSQIGAEELQIDESQLREMPLNLRQVREAAETRAIQRAIVLSDGNISQAAKLLGLTRPTLYSLMDKYSIHS
ncbi:PEP-CTERM-box response regulator transcription factor [Kangiella sediminilitoris]|uniref:Fis family transcriptional regulator n=1 Tax=Kangiella sediminilitoris TaxID=1144748 RepID=A0A1B3B7U9_9GAMM|nr:PEP-CTERM-box response regulator transcription factor [Kangiella sediminilitoris]AOE48875.1 Fis family transcriptional regulator [Kangiella sediminilitoris]